MNDERFEAIFRKHYARVWRYFRTNSVADDEAHDLAQDAFKRLFERMDQIRNDDPWPFLATIAKTVLLNHIRARQTQKRNASLIAIDDPDLSFPELAVPAGPDYAERQAEEALWKRVHAAVASLPSGQYE